MIGASVTGSSRKEKGVPPSASAQSLAGRETLPAVVAHLPHSVPSPMRLAPPHQRLMLCSMSMARSMMTSAPSSLPLKDPSLFVGRGFIGGEWVGADDGSTVDVTDPASGLCLGSIPNMGGSETRRAVEAAEAAFASWRSKTGKERGAVLRRWFDLIMANQQDLAAIMTAECGKPMAEAVGEIAYGASIVEWCAGDTSLSPPSALTQALGASFVEWFAEEAKRVYGDVVPNTTPGTRILVLKQPVGVVGAVTPWSSDPNPSPNPNPRWAWWAQSRRGTSRRR